MPIDAAPGALAWLNAADLLLALLVGGALGLVLGARDRRRMTVRTGGFGDADVHDVGDASGRADRIARFAGLRRATLLAIGTVAGLGAVARVAVAGTPAAGVVPVAIVSLVLALATIALGGRLIARPGSTHSQADSAKRGKPERRDAAGRIGAVLAHVGPALVFAAVALAARLGGGTIDPGPGTTITWFSTSEADATLLALVGSLTVTVLAVVVSSGSAERTSPDPRGGPTMPVPTAAVWLAVAVAAVAVANVVDGYVGWTSYGPLPEVLPLAASPFERVAPVLRWTGLAAAVWGAAVLVRGLGAARPRPESRPQT